MKRDETEQNTLRHLFKGKTEPSKDLRISQQMAQLQFSQLEERLDNNKNLRSLKSTKNWTTW